MHKKLFFVLLLMIFQACIIKAQQSSYIIYFKDKGPEAEKLLLEPGRLLSEKAIERRRKIQAGITADDLPVSHTYLEILSANKCRILQTSKWLNAVTVETNVPAQILFEALPQIRAIKKWFIPSPASVAGNNKFTGIESDTALPGPQQKTGFDYGFAELQNKFTGIDYLHNKGFRGDSVLIALVDAGFTRVNTIRHFDSLRTEKRIKATYDFWGQRSNVYTKSDHGTAVLSILAANTPGEFVGTAPKADYILTITDDLFTETHQDELNWIKAVEYADSLGADIINSSLGYKKFDAGHGDYSYSNMDGNTSIIAKGANIAASKGLLIVNSAGNSGHISTPCDVATVLCVGGAFPDKRYDEISSFGPTADNRIKPDVAGMSGNVSYIRGDGTIFSTWYGGTSTAAPQISGLAACLLQAHPKRNAQEIISAIILSAHNYPAPDNFTGHGIPNARIADSLLTLIDINGINERTGFTDGKIFLFPNPAKDAVTIKLEDAGRFISEIRIFSVMGKLVFEKNRCSLNEELINLAGFPPGIYFMRVLDNKNQQTVHKMIKG